MSKESKMAPNITNGVTSFAKGENLTDADESGYITVKKRVGGGFKYVKVKVEGKQTESGQMKQKEGKGLSNKNINEGPEKHEFEHSEKGEKENTPTQSPAESYESFSLPLSTTDLRRDSLSHVCADIGYIRRHLCPCEGKIRYGDYPILKYIQENVIGHNVTISGPFGHKRAVYCDYTASGRCLTFIEDYIRTFVCPFYANTHSETGRNARQTSKFREEARSIIRKCVNAGKDDVVIFTGSGATAALHKIAWGLKITQPRVAEETVVLIGPYEHHANMLLWKEFGTTVVRIRDKDDGLIDVEHLVAELKFWKDKRRHMLVCVSAASNVTGIVTDTDEISRIAHQHGALVAFDYAGGGPYLDINMNSSKQCYKDAVFISPHKFVGGPGSPGVVVAKKWMFKNQIPDRVGGGTVVYVSRETHAYTSDIEAREEGGTPAIIESIRTGLAFQLKAAVTEKLIATRDEDLCCRAFLVWERNPNLIVLGSHTAERITIFSFVVKHEDTGKYVHYNFISTLLNDLFGIQSRGGCACAGPYGHDLLGISEPMAKRLKWFTNEQAGMDPNVPESPMGIMRPGFVRVNLPYFYDEETIDYVIKAVDMVAAHGWKLLPLYSFDPYSGAFVYKGEMAEENEEQLFSLQDIDYRGNFHVNRKPPDLTSKISLQEMLRDADNILKEISDDRKARVSTASRKLHDLIPKEKRKLRWFLSPQEASDLLTGTKKVRRYKQFMTPRLDSRMTESDSAPETCRSQMSETTRVPETKYDNMAVPEKNRRTSVTEFGKEIKSNKFNLENVCEDCETDKVEKIRTRPPFSKLQDTGIKMASTKFQQKSNEQSSYKQRQSAQNSKLSLTPRDRRASISLPKI